jgi:hypothetical protein
LETHTQRQILTVLIFLTKFPDIQLAVSFVPSLQLPYGLGRGKNHNPAKPHSFFAHCSHNPEASRTNVLDETL